MGYVILTRGPENFPEARVKMTYPPHHPAKSEKKIKWRKFLIFFEISFFLWSKLKKKFFFCFD